MPLGIQPWHLVVIFLVALIIFGPSKLPDLGRTIGKTMKEFRDGTRDMTEGIKEELSRPEPNVRYNDPVSTTIDPRISTPDPSGFQKPVYPQNPVGDGNFCPQCGAPNLADARFCNKCGNQIQKP